MGRCPYHPKMMLKVIVYAYMNNIYSCRKIEKLLSRDVHFIPNRSLEKASCHFLMTAIRKTALYMLDS